MAEKKNVGIVGATGVVGKTIASVLEERAFPVGDFRPAATDASSGREVGAFGTTWPVCSAADLDFSKLDVCFFTAGAAVSRDLVPRAIDAGCRVVDNTTAFRMEADVPLVVPEINADTIKADTLLASCPNCTAIVLVMTLWPLLRGAEIERVVVTSFQSVSGAGKRALDELDSQVASRRSDGATVFTRPIAFNCLPQIGDMLDSGFTVEEDKIVAETRKILNRPTMKVVPTAVRVPVRVSHSLSVNVEMNKRLGLDEIARLWRNASGVRLDATYPTPIEIAGTDDVVIGRLRSDTTRPAAVSYWAVGDNLRKGAATNSVQIAEVMFRR
jgi:aspartate-semialdehyde dehydrogenase